MLATVEGQGKAVKRQWKVEKRRWKAKERHFKKRQWKGSRQGGVAHLIQQVGEHGARDLSHPVVAPSPVPQDGTAGVYRRVGLAAQKERVVGRVHRQRDVQVPLDTRDEECVERVVHALGPHLVVQRGEQWVELLRGVQAWDLPAGEQRVDALEELRRDQLVVQGGG